MVLYIGHDWKGHNWFVDYDRKFFIEREDHEIYRAIPPLYLLKRVLNMNRTGAIEEMFWNWWRAPHI